MKLIDFVVNEVLDYLDYVFIPLAMLISYEISFTIATVIRKKELFEETALGSPDPLWFGIITSAVVVYALISMAVTRRSLRKPDEK